MRWHKLQSSCPSTSAMPSHVAARRLASIIAQLLLLDPS